MGICVYMYVWKDVYIIPYLGIDLNKSKYCFTISGVMYVYMFVYMYVCSHGCLCLCVCEYVCMSVKPPQRSTTSSKVYSSFVY